MADQEDASDRDIESVDVEWLISELDRHQRRPPWYDEAEPPHFSGPADSTFQKDKVTWSAYRCAKRRALCVSRFEGQAALRRKIEALDRAASHRIEATAKKLRDNVSPELRDRVATWEVHKYRRRRRTRRIDVELMSSSAPAPAASPDADTESQLASSSPTRQLSDACNTPTNSRSLPESSLPNLSQPFTTLGFQQSFSTASPSKAKAILPDDLFLALKKTYSERNELVVCIGMSYNKEREYYVITLDISPNKVQRFAKELFGMNIETSAGHRYLTFGNIKVLPNPKSTIQGCRLNMIEPFFGRTLQSAVQASEVCKIDIQELSDHTQAISMEMSHNAEDGAVLILRTDFSGFADVWAKLHGHE